MRLTAASPAPRHGRGSDDDGRTHPAHQILDEDLIAIAMSATPAELTLTCEHLCGWLRDASPVVIDSLRGFGGADVGVLIDTLGRLAGALSRAFPSVSPHRVTGSAALCPAETLSIAEFLLGIAGNG